MYNDGRRSLPNDPESQRTKHVLVSLLAEDVRVTRIRIMLTKVSVDKNFVEESEEKS